MKPFFLPEEVPVSLSFPNGNICGIYYPMDWRGDNFNCRFKYPDNTYFNVTQYRSEKESDGTHLVRYNIWHPRKKGVYLPVSITIEDNGLNKCRIVSFSFRSRPKFFVGERVKFAPSPFHKEQLEHLASRHVEHSLSDWLGAFMFYLWGMVEETEKEGWWYEVKKK